jgi:formylglycine-generating enzyme required for sulfatase activity
MGKRIEPMDTRISFTAMAFRKVLKGFEIGGLPYAEVQFQLKRLLATGASPRELREVLRRSQLIEPLPEYALREVLSLLDGAVEPSSTEGEADGEVELSGEVDSAPAPNAPNALDAARSELEAAHSRIRAMEATLADRVVSEQATRSQLERALKDTENDQAELRSARGFVASRDKVIAQIRHSLDERDAQLATLQREYGETSAALQTERRKVQEIERSLTEGNVLSGTVRARSEETQRQSERYQVELLAARESLSVQQKSLSQLQNTLGERDAQLSALRREQGKAMSAVEARAKKTELELQAVQRRFDGIKLELRSSKDSIAAANAQVERGESQLAAARRELGASKAEQDRLLAQVAGLQSKLRDSGALVEKLQSAVRSEAQRAAQWQAAAKSAAEGQEAAQSRGLAQLREAAQSRDAAPSSNIETLPAPPAADVLPAIRAPFLVRVGRWNADLKAAAIWGGAAVLFIALLAWFIVHRSPAPKVAIAPAVAVPRAGETLQDCPTCPAVTILPAGRFAQGSVAASASAFEKPLHTVVIAHPLALSTSAVTVDEFRAFVEATGRDMQGCDVYDGQWRVRADGSWQNPGFVQTGSHPVTCTSWNDAKAYAAWLSAKTGHPYRLPSAAEWEYAARSGGTAVQPWSADGSDACTYANVADASAARRYPGWSVFACNDGFVQTSPVGSFKANSYGLNDMMGNVFQWTEDCWQPDYQGAPADGSARVDGNCAERELRGGSWFSNPAYVRSSYRNHFAADYRTSSVGIRLARDLEP